jgi:hypothetical protein
MYPHPGEQKRKKKEHKQQQMLVRVQGKRNLYKLLVGMYISTTVWKSV